MEVSVLICLAVNNLVSFLSFVSSFKNILNSISSSFLDDLFSVPDFIFYGHILVIQLAYLLVNVSWCILKISLDQHTALNYALLGVDYAH